MQKSNIAVDVAEPSPRFGRIACVLMSAAAAITALSSFPAAAQAPFIEPYAGVAQVQIAIYDQQYNDYQDKDIASGFMLGIKGGYAFNQRVFAGLDYQTGGPFVFGRPAGNGEWTVRMLGGGVGLDYDVARFWAGYYFDTEIDDSKNQVKFKGDGFKVGFGLKLAKNIHANLDVALDTLKTAESTGGGGGGAVPLTKPPKVTLIFASISIPIELK